MADKKSTAPTAKGTTAAAVAANGGKNEATAPKYSVKELSSATAALFPGVTPDCVTAALRSAGLTACTKEEAQEVVAAFAATAIQNPKKKEGK